MTMLAKNFLVPVVALLSVATMALAQPGPGMGGGRGGMAGPGAGWQCNQSNTPGFTLMSAQERAEHQSRMRAMQSYDECIAYIGEHHGKMAARAQEQGVALPAPRNPCDMMKARGRIK